MPLLLIVLLWIVCPPLPGWLVDATMVSSLIVPTVGILLALYLPRPAEFLPFCRLLVVAPLGRVALNLAATRIILMQSPCGHLLPIFGRSIWCDGVMLGVLTTLALLFVQLVVIPRECRRVDELATHHTLDYFPGAQMRIDEEVLGQTMGPEVASARRQKLENESGFYTSLNGLGLLILGESQATCMLLPVNLVFGLVTSCLIYQHPFPQALSRVALLTMGNALLATLSAFLMATALGLVVARAAAQDQLCQGSSNQSQGQLLMLATVLLAQEIVRCSLHSSFPTLPLLVLGGLLHLGFTALRSESRLGWKGRVSAPEVHTLLAQDPLEIEFGRGLLGLVDPAKESALPSQVPHWRRQLALDLGIVLPGLRLRDNAQLGPQQYRINVFGVEVAVGQVVVDRLMAVGPPAALAKLSGPRVCDPVYGLPAVWVEDGTCQAADLLLFDAVRVIGSHLLEVARAHAADLVDRDQVQRLLLGQEKLWPDLVRRVLGHFHVTEIHQLLRNLLREQVPVGDFYTILQVLVEFGPHSKDLDLVTEQVRRRLGAAICRPYLDSQGALCALVLTPRQEEGWLAAGPALRDAPPQMREDLLDALRLLVQSWKERGVPPVLLTSARLRPQLRKFTQHTLPEMVILSRDEIPPNVRGVFTSL